MLSGVFHHLQSSFNSPLEHGTPTILEPALRCTALIVDTFQQSVRAQIKKEKNPCHESTINDTNLPCWFQGLVLLVEKGCIHKSSGAVIESSRTPVDMAEDVNLGFLFLHGSQ